VANLFRYDINIKNIEDVAEKDTATKIAKGLESPNAVAKRGEISELIRALKSFKSESSEKLVAQFEKILNSLLSKKITSTNTGLGRPIPGQGKKVTQTSQTKTAESKSLIDSSNSVMSQIQRDFINFKINFGKSVREHLTSAHGEAFKVIGSKKDQYTQRGGSDVLKIADMGKLVNVLRKLGTVTEKEIVSLKSTGPGKMLEKAIGPIMEQAGLGIKKTKGGMSGLINKITDNINKHGYEGLNKALKTLVKSKEGRDVTTKDVRKAVSEVPEGKTRTSISQDKLYKVLSETAGRTSMRDYLGDAIKEIEIPRPVRGPQGAPSIKAQSGRYRALTKEYSFTPGIMVAAKKAEGIIKSSSVGQITDKTKSSFKETVPKIGSMLLGDKKAEIASFSSNIVDVMKTDRRGRQDLIKAYRETITSRKGKVDKEPELKTKKQQLDYLDKLSTKAKKLSIGFDDVIVAMGKFSGKGIYDKLYEGLTKESQGKTSPLRTTVRDIADPSSLKTFKKRIRKEFIDKDLVEEDRPQLALHQQRSVKVNVPKLVGEDIESVSGAEKKADLIAQNRELEKFLNIKRVTEKGAGFPKALTSFGIGESRSVDVKPDSTNKARQSINMFSGVIEDFMPLGDWANKARSKMQGYFALGGGTTAGGKVKEGLEVPLLQSKKGRQAEAEGVFGKGGYGLNLQTVMQDSSGTFEDQIEIAGKAVNRFAKYIKPKIKSVGDVDTANATAKDIVSQFAPGMAESLRMKDPAKAGESKTLITEVSKILTGPGGENLNTRAVKIVEMIFTKLGTKMTTHAGSKGVVTFGKGKEGELGSVDQPVPYHELIKKSLEKKKVGKGKKETKSIDSLMADLDKAGSAPFVGFMHKNLSKEIQLKYKKIRANVNKILDFDVSVTTDAGGSVEKQTKALKSNMSKMSKSLGSDALTRKIPTEVRMSLTGAVKRLNLMEPLETVVNNIAGNVKTTDPGLKKKQLTQTGEVSQTLQALGYGWGPEEKLPKEERTLPMYSGKGDKGVISGQKFWKYIREPEAQQDWSEGDIESGRKGQKLNVAAMSALMSTFGEKSEVVKEAMGGRSEGKGKAIENIMALSSLGEKPLPYKGEYVSTKGMRELPGVISKHEELKNTVLDLEKFGAGGFAKIPDFEEGKEVGKRPLYVPSRRSLNMYAEQGEGVSANKLASIYNSLLTNVEGYEATKSRKYTKSDKPDKDILRRNVKEHVGKTGSKFREFLTMAQKGEGAVSGESLNNLINYFRKTKSIIEESISKKDPALKTMKTSAADLLKGGMGRGGVREGGLNYEIDMLEKLSKGGKGLSSKKDVNRVKGLVLNIKDNLLEPRTDTAEIKRVESDLEKARKGKSFTELSGETYGYYKGAAARATKRGDKVGTKEFEEDSPEMRTWMERGLNKRLKVLRAGEGKKGLLSTSDVAVGTAAKQFGITTDPKKQALEESVRNIEKDKRRLREDLVKSTIGKEKGVDVLQSGKIPAIKGTLSAAINDKVDDFDKAANIVNKLSEKGVLGDPKNVESIGNSLVNSIITQKEKHGAAVEEGRGAGRVVLKEGEIGLPASKLEKLKGDYGQVGDNLLDAVRAGKNVQVMSTRFPVTGISSHQFGTARELKHQGAGDVVALPGAAPGLDVKKVEGILTTLKKQREIFRKKRSYTTSDADRSRLTKNILELSKAIELVTVKFSGFAQGADIDGDTLMVHAGKTKKAQKEIADVSRASRSGSYGAVGTQDPRSFINKMMNYNIAGNKSSMAELTSLYSKKSDVKGSKIFEMPSNITREMKDLSLDKVNKALMGFGVTEGQVKEVAGKKGFTEKKQVESVAREMLYDQVRNKQFEKTYVKAGLGESTESINRLSRFMDASVGFGDKPTTKKEYGGWKPESVALGAVYEGDKLKQKARPGREIQTMMNALLKQVISSGMSVKHGGKTLFDTVSKGMSSGTLFETMEKDPKSFNDILKANEVIKTTIRDRLDALNSVDFLAEVRRVSPTTSKGSSDKDLLKMRRNITEKYADRFSFEGFLGDASKDIQNQIFKTAETPKQKRVIEKKLSSGELDLAQHFPQMQKSYGLRTFSASIDKVAQKSKEGKTTLDRAINRVLGIIKSSGSGTTISDSMMQNSFNSLFDMFNKAERLGLNLDKLFKGKKSLKTKKRIVGGAERVLGMPTMSSVEKELVRKEGAEKFREKYPKASEEDVSKSQEKYLLSHREMAVKKYIESTKQKKQLLGGVVPSILAKRDKVSLEKAEDTELTRRQKGEKGKEWRQQLISRGYEQREPRVASRYKISGLFPAEGKSVTKTEKGYGQAGIFGARAKPESSEARDALRILGGGVKGVKYSINSKDSETLIKILNKYTSALNRLLEGTTALTKEQTLKAQEALSVVKQGMGKLKQIPAGTVVGKVAGKLRSVYEKVGESGLTDFASWSGLDVKSEKEKAVAVQEQEKKKKAVPNKYKTELDALSGLVGKAEAKIGLKPEEMPSGVMDTLAAVREKSVPDLVTSEMLKTSMKDVPYTKQSKIWSQYHLEKVRGELDLAQVAEEEGSVGKKEGAIGRAKAKILTSYGAVTSPFLEREGGSPKGRVTGYTDEDAVGKLGVYRVSQTREKLAESTKHISATAGKAIEPVLLGTGRMEERLKAMWSMVRGFNSELAKSGKYADAFNFDRAEADLAIIKSTLKGFQSKGQFTPEEYSDVEHAIRQVTKAEKAYRDTPKEALSTLAIPGLETTETAEAVHENKIAATMKDMLAKKSLAVGETMKVISKIPTGEGQFEKREDILTAMGAEGVYAPGVVSKIKRTKGKTTAVREEASISRRSVRLIQEFEKSTKNINEKIKDVYLGIKRFDSATGKVNFDEALEDLASMQEILKYMLKTPGISAKSSGELKQLQRMIGAPVRAIAGTSQEALPGTIMKGMETPASAMAALREQARLQSQAMWEDESLAVGKTMTVAANIPTKSGAVQKRQIQLKAIGEGGVVTGIEETEVKPVKRYVEDLTSKSKTRATNLFKEFATGAGDVNSRISKMVIGIKQFDQGLVKAGKYSKSINFDDAEKDLIEIMSLLNNVLKGAAILTEEERVAYKQAESVAKAMYQKVTKTPGVAQKGITMGGYETPESSLAAHRAKIEQETKKLMESNVIGKSAVVKSKLMTETGAEVPISKRLTARGSRFFGFGGNVNRVSEREEAGGGQVGSVIRRVAMWGAASGAVYGIIGGAKQMIQTMKQAETGMVNLQKVMSPVTTDFNNMRNSAVRFAKDYGAELMGVLETMRIFAQQGLPQEQVKEMARVSTLASNVTTMKPVEAAEALTSATRQFNIEGEKSISILDSWNEVENKFAITAKDLADGFKKAGTAAKITGIDVHKLNGIITAIGESTRQTGKEVGTSLKFIFSRMATEKAPRALTAVGVQTMEGGNLREGSSILDDLAKKWVGLTRSQKLATAQAIGGIRHYNALMVLMSNYDRALSATSASINSIGSAEKENKLIMETYEKKAAQLKASFDALAVSASGPVLASLKGFTGVLNGLVAAMSSIPGGALAAIGTAAYGTAVGLGKYFDLSMFGLLGSSVGGAKRKARGPKDLVTTLFSGKRDIGENLIAGIPSKTKDFKNILKTPSWRGSGRSGGVSLGPPIKKLDLIKKGYNNIKSAAKTAAFSTVGLVSSFGMFGKIAVGVGIAAGALWGFDKVMRTVLSSAEDKTKDYKETLDKVEESLKAIGDIKLLKTKIEIETARIDVLKNLTPEQKIGQVEGMSYKSPTLMRKQQIADVKNYAGSVARLTNEGLIGFDKFGNAIVATTDNLGLVIDKLETVATKAKVELKLKIEKEELKELFEPPDIKGGLAKAMYTARESIGNVGKNWNIEFMEKYAESRRTPFENLQKSLIEINKLQREAGRHGKVIRPPRPELEKTDPKQYKKDEEDFKEWTKAQDKRIGYSKEINEKFLEVRRDFFTIRGPEITSKLAGEAAFGDTGQMLAGAEQAQASKFYAEQGATTEDIAASFFHRLRGINVRATAKLTEEAAMEQGIPFRPVKKGEDRTKALGDARAKDILIFKQGSSIASNQASVFESQGKLYVQFAKRSVDSEKEKTKHSVKTLEAFKQIPKYAKDFVGTISSVGLLSPTEMRLKSVSRAFVGAEAGMFKPRKESKLELGKKYRYQVPTEMLIQNNAFKTMSKTTVGFVTDYIKKQGKLRGQQKAALSVYEKRAAISGQTARVVSEMTESLIKFSNEAIQFIRTVVDLEKSLEQLKVGYNKQAAVQQFRRKNLVSLTGPMTGMPVIPAPKVDLRKVGELSPHERLRLGSKKYEGDLIKYTDKLAEYNYVAKRGEKISAAQVDIEYIRGLEKERPGSVEDLETLVKSISKTGDLSSGSQLLELEKQTTLEAQSATSLNTIVSLLSGGKAPGLLLLEQASGATPGPEQNLAFDRANMAIKSDLKVLLGQGNFEDLSKYYEKIKSSNSEFGTNRVMSQFFEELNPASIKDALIGSGAMLPEPIQHLLRMR